MLLHQGLIKEDNMKTEDDYKAKNALRRLVSKIAMHIDPDMEIEKINFNKKKESKGKLR